MDILIVTSDYPQPGGLVHGGVGGATYSLAQALKAFADLRVSVLVPTPVARDHTSGSSETLEDGVLVRRLPLPASSWRGLDLLWHHSQIVTEAIGAIPHDLLHVQGDDRLAARHATERTVLTIHGIAERDAMFHENSASRWPRHIVLKALHQEARRQVHNIVSINPYVREVLGLRQFQRIWDIPNPVPRACFETTANPQPGRIVLPGRVIPRKNVAGAIKAFSILSRDHPHATLHIAGSGEARYTAHCQSLARALELGDRIRFLGGLPPPMLQRELAAAEVVLLSSFQETAPIVVAESMAIGAPVVATDAGGVRHMIRDGATGAVIRGHDPLMIAAAVSHALASPNLRASWAASGRTVALATYHPTVVGSRTRDMYLELQAGR